LGIIVQGNSAGSDRSVFYGNICKTLENIEHLRVQKEIGLEKTTLKFRNVHFTQCLAELLHIQVIKILSMHLILA